MNKLFIGIVLTVLIIVVITAIVLLQPVNDVYCPVTWGECNKYGSRDSTTKFVSGRKCANVRNDMPGCDCVNSWGECNTDGVRVQTISQHRGGNGKPCAPSPLCDNVLVEGEVKRTEEGVKRTEEGGRRTEEGVRRTEGGKKNIGDIIMMKAPKIPRFRFRF